LISSKDAAHRLDISQATVWRAVAGGLLTVLLNLIRVGAVAAIAATIGVTSAILFHDYGGTLLVIGFLFAFWLFVQRRSFVPALGDLEAYA
jgi:exosortase/archaeosortase family protein